MILIGANLTAVRHFSAGHAALPPLPRPAAARAQTPRPATVPHQVSLGDVTLLSYSYYQNMVYKMPVGYDLYIGIPISCINHV